MLASSEIATSQLLGVPFRAITITNIIPKTSRHAMMTMQTRRLIPLHELTIFFHTITPWSIGR